MPFITNMAATYSAKTVAIAWDLYFSDSIKLARELRGIENGVRQQDLPRKGGMPKNWDTYLKNPENKTELFQFLAEKFLESSANFMRVTNVGETFSASLAGGTSLLDLKCTSKEEADGRIILHVKDTVQHGGSKILVRCSDADVVFLCISFYHRLESFGLKELWVLYSVGKKKRFIAAHVVAENLGSQMAEALRGFHAFTGCDSVSFFSSKSKASAWRAWKKAGPATTRAFLAISNPLQLAADGELESSVTEALEEYTVMLYGGESGCKSVDEARQTLFCSGNKPLTSIPPTKSALLQHMKRAAYQGGHIWGTADTEDYSPPPPDEWGWQRQSDRLLPLWSTLPNIWEACRELDVCGCSLDCNSRRCLCVKYNFPCCSACKKCKGGCSNKSNGE